MIARINRVPRWTLRTALAMVGVPLRNVAHPLGCEHFRRLPAVNA